MRTPGLSLLLATPLLLGTSAVSNAQTSAAKAVTTPAVVEVLNQHGQIVHAAKVRSLVTLSISARLPQGFPTGYTDVRFTVWKGGHAKRTVIYGTPKHVGAGSLVRIQVPTGISSTWVGQVTIIGMVRLLSKPGGMATRYAARGATDLSVSR